MKVCASNTSENPVQNKVVTSELQNVREVAEGKCRTFIVSYNDTFESVRQDVIDNDKKVYDINGNDITQEVIDGEFDPDFDYYCVNSRFNSQSEYIDLASGIYSVVIARGLYPGFVSGETSNFYVYIVNNIESQETEFHAGDEFLVIETEVPDRWYGNAYNAYKLETTKVDITGKLDKVTTSSTSNRVYAVDTSGNQTMLSVSSDASASTMVLRSETGIVRGATPVDNNDLTTKQYVDNAVSHISGTVVYQHNIYVTPQSGNQMYIQIWSLTRDTSISSLDVLIDMFTSSYTLRIKIYEMDVGTLNEIGELEHVYLGYLPIGVPTSQYKISYLSASTGSVVAVTFPRSSTTITDVVITL